MTASHRIGPIPTLPVFFKLRQRCVVLAGASPAAVWKAELLAATGARVFVFDQAPCLEMLTLADKRKGAVLLDRRSWHPDDLRGAALAIGALEGEEAARFRDAAHAAGVPVNIVDVPDLCDFQFGTLIARASLIIAISTDGAAPVFGQAIRARIEALLPAKIVEWMDAAKAWRPGIQAQGLSFSARRRFWEMFADEALSGRSRPPGPDDHAIFLDAALSEHQQKAGSLDLVGLGPGDPDGLTMAAVRALQRADVIVHDRSFASGVLALGRREATHVAEANDGYDTMRMIEPLILEGRRVVWAAPGDPMACSRWAPRLQALSLRPGTIVQGLPCGDCLASCPKRSRAMSLP